MKRLALAIALPFAALAATESHAIDIEEYFFTVKTYDGFYAPQAGRLGPGEQWWGLDRAYEETYWAEGAEYHRVGIQFGPGTGTLDSTYGPAQLLNFGEETDGWSVTDLTSGQSYYFYNPEGMWYSSADISQATFAGYASQIDSTATLSKVTVRYENYISYIPSGSPEASHIAGAALMLSIMGSGLMKRRRKQRTTKAPSIVTA